MGNIEFKSIGELAQAVVNKAVNGIEDERLLTCKAATGINSLVNSEGGYLVSSAMADVILATAQQKSLLYSKAVKISVSSYGTKIPMINETERNAAGQTDALRCFWVGEAEQKTISHPAFDQIGGKLHKLVARIPVTDELMQDVNALTSFINNFVGVKLGWFLDKAIIDGDPATSMTGLCDPAAKGVIGVAEADPIDLATLRNYEKALAPAVTATSEWYMSKENYNDVLDLITDANTNQYIKFENNNLYVFGHKCNVMEQMSDVCCNLILGDFSQYVVWHKGDTQNAISIGLKYNYDESELRFVLRVNGASYGNVYTLEDTTEVAPFVIPDCAPPVESSSSSSEVGLSSESSSSSVSTSSSTLRYPSSSSSSSSTSYVRDWSSSSSSSSKEISSSSSSSTRGTSSSSSSSTRGTSSSSSSSTSSTEVRSSSSSSSSVEYSSESSEEFSSSSSQSGKGTCAEDYCATTFSTGNINGNYSATGAKVDSKPVYFNGTYYLFHDATYDVWAISGTAGDPPPQWVTSQDVGDTCPDGAYVSESGSLAIGKC